MKSDDWFDAADLAALAARGIAPEAARRDVAWCADPPPPLAVHRPCTDGDGIRRLDDDTVARLHARFDSAARAGRVGRFVPASGAATRMFRDLQAGDAEALERFEAVRADLPFETTGVEDALKRFANQPKGLLPFHRTQTGVLTALDEQLAETAAYATDARGKGRLHMTVSAAHRDAFVAAVRETPVAGDFEVGFSVQSPATDVVAADPAGGPFRTDSGELLFRPGGHGALIGNLAALGGDLVLLKNIDNVQPARLRADTLRWKRAIGGLLVELQEAVHGHVRRLRAGSDPSAAHAFLTETLGLTDVPDAALLGCLDRPLRVCGVVPNTGHPGGGPFWASNAEGRRTPQIVEAQQLARPALLTKATHFNSVDLACGLRDADGQAFDLRRFVDPDAVMVSRKSHEGRELLAVERPGLWNGAMSGWNTVFVEVPNTTFTPVKTVFDLLRGRG